MKKALAFMLAMSMVLSLAACGGGDNGGNTGADNSNAGTSQPTDGGAAGGSESGSFKDARTLQADYPDQVAWNDMTEEELLEAAKAEQGDIIVMVFLPVLRRSAICSMRSMGRTGWRRLLLTWTRPKRLTRYAPRPSRTM